MASIGLGLLASGLALFIAACFSMGMALGDPWVVGILLVLGPALSLSAWAILGARSRRLERGRGHPASRPGFRTPVVEASPLQALFKFFCGIPIALLIFFAVCTVEGRFPGERRSDVFGPYYTHPYRPLAGFVLLFFGLVFGGYLYSRNVARQVVAGMAFGCVALGLVLVFAF